MNNQNNQNSQFVSLVNAFFCRVVCLPRMVQGRYMDGIVEYEGDEAEFSYGTSRNCVVNDGQLMFGPGKALRLQSGDEVIAKVMLGKDNRFVVTAWTHVQDHYEAARELAESRKAKSRPTFVPTAKVETAAVVPEKSKNQNRDRRPKVRKEGKLLPFERALIEASDEIEAQVAS